MFLTIQEGLTAYKLAMLEYAGLVKALLEAGCTKETLDQSGRKHVEAWELNMDGMAAALGLSSEERETIDDECMKKVS